ncbi:hypothetical protein QOZ98_001942 [Planomicrobium stackebrandtii]|uniref:DUF4129 domain-containing protein n=1 Tax=Planomicrobium stackebrandtii TaxID=253160 RepID=A0ABU0GX42_9BACL|nr:hypothetical protein [Planomicrobium stackebrandtii]MDQ0429115.1 hypothetical protein [Planomicrobium stackebrandtii]
MTARLISAIYFMLDAFIISLILVFVAQETALPAVWTWILAALGMSCISCFLFSKTPYRLIWAVGMSIAAAMWTAGVSLWLALILGMLATYLLHARYSVLSGEFNHGHHFLMKFLVVFSVCWIVLLLNPEEQTSRLLFTIAPAAILFYLVSSLLHSYFYSKADGARLSLAVGAFGIVATLSAAAATITFFIADEVRSLAGWVVGGAIRILFWPLALLLEQVTSFLSGLSTEEEMQETLDKLGPDGEAAQGDTAASEALPSDFPVEIFLGLVVLACAIALVLWLRKIKPDSKEQVQESQVIIKRHDHPSALQFLRNPASPYSQNLDLHQIREVFRGLELLATEQQMGRKNYETVREWIVRMQWDVTDSFFKTYDQVRYGDKQLPDSQANQFISEIAEIKDRYLKENV